jgi:hypothetical protein
VDLGRLPLVAASLLALAMSVLDYFLPENGIDGSLGVLLVIGSTLLLTLASAATAFRLVRGGLRTTLLVLILLDILGTGFAAYMLEAEILLGVTALAFFAWLFDVFVAERQPRRMAASAETAR